MTRSARNGGAHIVHGPGWVLVMERDWCFVKGGTGRVYDAGMSSPTFFRVPRSKSGLDSRDSHRIGLGFSPVGCCSLPLRGQGHCMRVQIEASDSVFGLILGDSGQDFGSAWTCSGFVLGLARVISRGAPAGREKIFRGFAKNPRIFSFGFAISVFSDRCRGGIG